MGAQPQGQTPFIPFPQQLSSSIYRLSAEGAPEELWNSRDESSIARAESDGRLLAGTGNSGALLPLMGAAFFAQLAKLVLRRSPASHANSAGKLFSARKSRKSLLRGPSTNRRAPTSPLFRRAALFAMGAPGLVESSTCGC